MVELPLYRWWTDGWSKPVEVEILKYCGDATWQIRFPNGAEPEVEEDELYINEWDADNEFLETTEEMSKAIDVLLWLAKKNGQTIQQVVDELIADRNAVNAVYGR